MNKKDKPTELSYYGLYLLSHLKENHPDKAHDAAFIESLSLIHISLNFAGHRQDAII